MPRSTATSLIESQIIGEYERRCWTATAKANKYVKVYSLLQQATEPSRIDESTTAAPTTAAKDAQSALHKQAQFRHLMARVCLAKLACPVSSALHSIEAAVAFLECHLHSQAATCVQEAIAAVQEENPPYGSIKAAMAALKQPVTSASGNTLSIAAATQAMSLAKHSTGTLSAKHSSSLHNPNNHYTVSERRDGRGGRPADVVKLLQMFNPAASSATFGPVHVAPPVITASNMFQAPTACENSIDSLQRFFDAPDDVVGRMTAITGTSAGNHNGTSTTPSERFAGRFAYALLRVCLQLAHSPILSSETTSSILSKALDLLEWLRHKKHMALHQPSEEKKFNYESPLMKQILAVPATSSNCTCVVPSFDVTLTEAQAQARIALAHAHLEVWLANDEMAGGVGGGGGGLSSSNSPILAAATATATPPATPMLTPAASATGGAMSPPDPLRASEELLVTAAKATLSTLASKSTNTNPASTTTADSTNPNSAVLTQATSAVDQLLLGYILNCLAHGAVRRTWTYNQMLLHDYRQCRPNGEDMAFGPHIYANLKVREFEALVMVTEPPSPYAQASLAMLRQCWSLLYAASNISKQLTDMFGADSLAPTGAAAGVGGPAAGPGGINASPASANAQNHSRLRIARRQMRLTYKNALLDEFDQCVALYQRRRFGLDNEDANAAASRHRKFGGGSEIPAAAASAATASTTSISASRPSTSGVSASNSSMSVSSSSISPSPTSGSVSSVFTLVLPSTPVEETETTAYLQRILTSFKAELARQAEHDR